MKMAFPLRWLVRPLMFGLVLVGFGEITALHAVGASMVWPVQMPYEAPPKSEPVPDVSIAPNTKPLTPEELQRAEALLPLLEGKQELWAMGAFVHLGESVIPVVTKGLTMPGPRVRYNAIETLSMIKAPAAVPALLETAKLSSEIPRIREHALRVAVRLDSLQAPAAIQIMAKDPNAVIRKAAAFEARYVRHKDVIQPLIDMVSDEERFVAMSAVQSLWMLTRHETESHDWDASSRQDRQAWAEEWTEWWNQSKDTFELPEPKYRKRAS
jgi:hypothetical protein